MVKTRRASGGRAAGTAAALVGALSNQLGAASGALAFPIIGPVGVVAIRQLVAAAILLPIVRPRFRSFTGAQWWPVLLLAVIFGTMNLSLYLAVERIGLGLAVTLEFCGPLTVALLNSRTRRSVFCAVIAGAGVIAIARPEPTTDYIGIALGLAAACSWAAYILVNRIVGFRIDGVQGTATAAGISALLFLPVGLCMLGTTRPDVAVLLYAVGAGVFASTIPFIADLVALRTVPSNLFGILMSVNPVLAALIGAIVLHEALGAVEWAGIALIITANTAILVLSRRTRKSRTPDPAL